MKSLRISMHRAVRTVCILALFFLTVSSASAQPGLMLFYEIDHDLLVTSDHFSVSVYEDGVALLHYPEYMEKAGDYSVQLSAAELQEMRLLLEHPLVQGFDPRQIGAEKKRIDEQSQELFAISDDSHSRFEINLDGTEKSIRWANLSVDADRYPEIGILRKLADFEAELLELDEHPTATVVDG